VSQRLGNISTEHAASFTIRIFSCEVLKGFYNICWFSTVNLVIVVLAITKGTLAQVHAVILIYLLLQLDMRLNELLLVNVWKIVISLRTPKFKRRM
jgi:hypothetical protein